VRARRALPALALLIAVVLGGCSDANTPEEKAWTDTGVDPRIVTLYVPPRLERLGRELVDRYQALDHQSRFLVATVEDDVAGERVADAPTPAVWITADEVIEEAERPEEIVPVGIDLLVVASLSEDGQGPLALSSFGADGFPTGLCEVELRCGTASRAVLEAAGVEPDPDFEGTEAEVARALFDREVRGALVHATYATAYFPRVVGNRLPLSGSDAVPYQAARYGDTATAVLFMGWLRNTGELGRVISQTSGMIPATPAT
jgi:hypothetical protein